MLFDRAERHPGGRFQARAPAARAAETLYTGPGIGEVVVAVTPETDRVAS